MTKKEIGQLLFTIQTAFPRFYDGKTKEELAEAMNLWFDIFKDDDASVVSVATKELICSSEYPPTIAAIKKKIYSLTTNEVDNMTLWNELDRAARNCLYNTQTIFDNLSPLVKKFVGSPAQLRELALTDPDVFTTVTKGQFLKQMEILKKREQEAKMMLPESRQLIENLTGSFKLLE